MPHETENDLHDKLQSKMQTSALLAGFTSATFAVVLTQSDYWSPSTVTGGAPAGSPGLAVTAGLVLLALATLLFVVAIYMYDRLTLPSRYWDRPADASPCRQERWPGFSRNHERHGLLYAYMVWVWTYVFTAAVAMALLGFTALVLHRGVWLVTVLYFAAIGGAIVYYLLFRPNLGVD